MDWAMYRLLVKKNNDIYVVCQWVENWICDVSLFSVSHFFRE